MSRTTPADTAAAKKPRGLLAKFFGHSAVRYLIVGGLSFAVDFGLLVLLREVFHWDVGIASATSFLSSLVFNFLLQRKFSFESVHRTHVSMIRYGILVVANTLATVLIVQLLTPTVLGYIGGKVISTAAMTVWNFFLYRHWVFGKKPTHHGAHEHKHLLAEPGDHPAQAEESTPAEQRTRPGSS
ncbi:hypothetical protein GU243_07460 [Pseudarthrobacter psychrotolerans]|uniref:GtrA/DPMS transmembrane domain-containing protein n=1 Tax=Pseudarthrobacter psychrotolerans TaxID=2697569 RepID=A0A6P1NS50_9MICC|nr:GtrA family protein [Pseudarthrobacter psychrotolerans]QHK19601.1 hypothetical protein GU243_07460 [Pseudarthrobacter psychrotolerans]